MSAAGIFASNLISDAGSLFAPKSASSTNKSNPTSQSAFAAIQQKLSSLDSGSNSGASSLSSQLSQLGQDLASGNLSASQADFNTLRTSLGQGPALHSGHSSPPPILTGVNHAPPTLSLSAATGSSQSNAANPWMAAMQTYSSLQQNPNNSAQSSSLLLPANTFSATA